MIQQVRKFFKTVSLFGFCSTLMREGHFLITDRPSMNSFRDLWNYCKEWVDDNV